VTRGGTGRLWGLASHQYAQLWFKSTRNLVAAGSQPVILDAATTYSACLTPIDSRESGRHLAANPWKTPKRKV
jgi:hypothetical protein